MASRAPDFDALIEVVYEAPLEEVPWRNALTVLRRELDCAAVTLILRSPAEGDSGLILTEGGTPDWESAYSEHYFALDPFVGLTPDCVITLQEVIPMEDFVASDFYESFMRPSGTHHILGFDTHEPGGFEARFRASRSLEGEAFGASEKRLCEQLLPHLKRALQIHSRIALAESERDVYAKAVEQFAVGAIFLDRSGKVLQMNRVAERLVGERAGLRVVDGSLCAAGQAASRELARMIAAAIEIRPAARPGVARALRIRRDGGGRDLGVVVRSVPPAEASDRLDAPAAVVFIGGPEEDVPLARETIRQLFDLTPAEASLAALLAAGRSLDRAAGELGITRNTARAHLRSVFSKSGVTRQAELVHLISRSVAHLG
ncbi:MAG: helix-turn-helix transcriptional regulator [Deltaproteobacteria bacterium]|nr:helix-turn-helix transcriptional regulator [Deltaproteobacteria bacterium]MBW2362247.1 helix-turn-helix transcriptional regulator [Deltaproteobacteria bacterium]